MIDLYYEDDGSLWAWHDKGLDMTVTLNGRSFRIPTNTKVRLWPS